MQEKTSVRRQWRRKIGHKSIFMASSPSPLWPPAWGLINFPCIQNISKHGCFLNFYSQKSNKQKYKINVKALTWEIISIVFSIGIVIVINHHHCHPHHLFLFFLDHPKTNCSIPATYRQRSHVMLLVCIFKEKLSFVYFSMHKVVFLQNLYYSKQGFFVCIFHS